MCPCLPTPKSRPIMPGFLLVTMMHEHYYFSKQLCTCNLDKETPILHCFYVQRTWKPPCIDNMKQQLQLFLMSIRPLEPRWCSIPQFIGSSCMNSWHEKDVFVQELELEKEEAEMVRCSPSKECWMGYDILALQWGWEDLKREPCKAQLQLRWYGLCRISESWPDMQPSRAHWIHPWAPVAINLPSAS